jgi:hypothetical protein
MALREYELYDNDHRSHRNLGQAAPLRPLSERTRTRINNVRRWDRLGGLLHVYQQVAWGVPSFGHPQSEKEIVGENLGSGFDLGQHLHRGGRAIGRSRITDTSAASAQRRDPSACVVARRRRRYK